MKITKDKKKIGKRRGRKKGEERGMISLFSL
jgi:hypothetical protein